MTLVLATPTRDGIVLAADRRSADPVRGVRDSLTKVVAVGPGTALALTGRPAFESYQDCPPDPPVFTTLYDAEAEVRDFYGSVEPSFPDTTQALTDRLASGFERYLETQPFYDWPHSGEPPEHALYQAVFVHGCRRQRRCQLVLAKFLYEKTINQPVRGMRWVEVPAEKLAYARTVPFGNLAVVRELRQGNDPRFNDLRWHGAVRRFLFEPTPASSVAAQEAADFSRWFIRVCSERTPLLDGSDFLVGPTCDVALVGEVAGFSWLP